MRQSKYMETYTELVVVVAVVVERSLHSTKKMQVQLQVVFE